MFCGLMSISSRSWPMVDENRTSLHCQFKFKRGNQCETLNIVDRNISYTSHSLFLHSSHLNFKIFYHRGHYPMHNLLISENKLLQCSINFMLRIFFGVIIVLKAMMHILCMQSTFLHTINISVLNTRKRYKNTNIGR